MDCACHDEPMYWNVDKRYAAGGFWKCRVRHQARIRARYRASAVAVNARRRDLYHAGGWIAKRRRDLRRQRAQALERLTQLEQEAVTLVSQSRHT